MSDYVIKVENLSKSYTIKHQQGERYTALRDVLSSSAKNVGNRLLGRTNGHTDTDSEEFWALNDVSFEIKQGERVGIIGRNGAGKSTLLKILSRITEPTSGRIHIKGRVASLLEVGTGFHPELTGRENIYLNGAILGMSREEIRRKFDEIVAFAEVEKFLDMPVKRYSSGMYVRLAFAVAANLEPEILVVDEVLAVGDAAFQKKCLGKMEDVATHEGRTILFVSHNLAAIKTLCSTGIVLNQGTGQFIGNVEEAILKYVSMLENNSGTLLSRSSENKKLNKSHYRSVNFFSGVNEVLTAAISGQPLDIVLKYNAQKPAERLEFAIGVYNYSGEKLLHFDTKYSNGQQFFFQKEGQFCCHIPKLPLPQGRYYINLSLWENGMRVDHVPNATSLDVLAGDFYGTGKLPPPDQNQLLIEHEWSLRH